MNKKKLNAVTVDDILQIMDQIAPPELAAEWDKIGLRVGRPDQAVKCVLLTLDLDDKALNQAIARHCELVIAHHPLFFSPLPAIRQDIPEQRLVQELIQNKISLIVAHTNLDAAQGGVADSLADILGLSSINRQSIGMYGRQGDLAEPVKLSQLIAAVRAALGASGCRVNTDQDRLISRLAVFPGSFSEDDMPLLEQFEVEALVCGELKHHIGLMLAARGIAAIDTGHDVSERVVLQPLAERLTEQLPQISFAVSGGFDYNKVVF